MTWIKTHTGKHFDFLSARVSDIDIRDIAASLSKLCRFTGHCKEFYSVAEHSVRVAQLVAKSEPQWALEALLHDASEAYLGDCSTPLKYMHYMEGYRLIENSIETLLRLRFNLDARAKETVKRFDRLMFSSEARILVGMTVEEYPDLDPLAFDIPAVGWTPHIAESVFLDLFYNYTQARSFLGNTQNLGTGSGTSHARVGGPTNCGAGSKEAERGCGKPDASRRADHPQVCP